MWNVRAYAQNRELLAWYVVPRSSLDSLLCELAIWYPYAVVDCCKVPE